MPEKKQAEPGAEAPAEQWIVTASYVEWPTGERQGRTASRGALLEGLSDKELKSLKSNGAVEKFKPNSAEHRALAGLAPIAEGSAE
jgi:hypothetical protein